MCCRSKKILEYWFGPLADENDFPTSDITERWFKADTTTDDTIRCLFGDDCRWALRGDFDHWAERPKDLLALIILLLILLQPVRSFLVDREISREVAVLAGHRKGVTAAACTPDGTRVL